jgi:hypothetical protein
MDAGGAARRARHAARSRRARFGALVTLALTVLLVFVGCSGGGDPGPGSVDAHGATLPTAVPSGTPGTPGTVTAFDPSVGAPLPYNRIVAAYGIVGGTDFNGPASSIDELTAFLPQLQQLGQQFAAADPVHPVKLGLDLVVNVIQPCAYFPQYCSSWADDGVLQQYVDFCKQHDLLLFFDLQLVTEPVQHAVTTHLLSYLEKYPFVELALDTEFHFMANAEGRFEAESYPSFTGCVQANDINWATDQLAQISLTYHLPRKVLLLHQFSSVVFNSTNPCYAGTSTKAQIKRDPNVSIVLQADGYGAFADKATDYEYFVQRALIEYGGYKLFLHYQDCPTSPPCAFDIDPNGVARVPTPQEVLQLFPQPLFISYE